MGKTFSSFLEKTADLHLNVPVGLVCPWPKFIVAAVVVRDLTVLSGRAV